MMPPTLPITEGPRLVIRYEDTETLVPLVGAMAWTLGRNEDNDIVLQDQWASRNHAMLQYMESGQFYLIDLGSLNGTFLNGRRVSIPVVLQNGDRITLGTTEISFLGCDAAIPVAKNTKAQRSTVMLHQRRLITVLVIDIRNFTGLTRQLEEQVLSQVIGTWFAKAGEIIHQHGSGVDKYIGDAIMAVWVHDVIRGTERIVPAEMLNVFQALYDLYAMSDSLNDRFPLPFRLRIGAGLNTGYAMVGQMGMGDRPEYTALGDTVNAAFRLESATKELGCDICLGETTYEQSPHAAVFLPFQKHTVTLKGYDAPTDTYAGTYEDLARFLRQAKAQPNGPPTC